LEEYKEKLTPMLEYVRHNVEEDAEAEAVTSSEFREHFKIWCVKEGHGQMPEINQKNFWPKMEIILRSEDIHFKKAKSGSQIIKGIRVKGLNDQHIKSSKTISDPDSKLDDPEEVMP
jgi:hypothetical protein